MGLAYESISTLCSMPCASFSMHRGIQYSFQYQLLVERKRNTKNDLHHAFPPKLLVTSFEPWNLEPLTFFCAKSIVRFLVRALNGYHQTICTQKWEYNLRVRKLPQSFIFLRCRSFSNKPIVHSPLLYYVLHLRTATHSRTHKLWQRVYQGLHPMIHNWIMSANVWAKPAIAAG